jgi:malonyl-CoA decarboxylase
MSGAKLPVPANDAPTRAGVFERALANLSAAWSAIAGSRAEEAAGAGERQRWLKRMRDCLEAPGGEVSARARTAALGHDFLALGPAARETFLRVLAESFDPDPQALARASGDYLSAATPEAKRAARGALAQALESPRLKLFTRFNALPQGVKFLVDLRATLIDLAARDVAFAPALDDLSELLRRWFDVGFLELRRIDWNTPAALLEKLIAYEAVHEIADWDDLKNRLDSDRRCFAFFHPRMADEPLIFVEVALTDGIAASIQQLLDPAAPVLDPARADTAIFYSISNAQAGLVGISLGNFLIKQVVERLAAEFPALRRFATLSPIPGFVRWLKSRPAEELLTPAERKGLPKREGDQHPLALIRNPDWHRNALLAERLRAPLLRAAARYLTQERRPDSVAARDSVAHFHLSNGARIEQLDWLGDISAKGMTQSAGLMVNYLYRLPEIDTNHEAYTAAGKIPAAAAIRALAKG